MSGRDLKKFAPYSLYLALAALIAFIGFWVVQGTFSLGAQISLGILILGLALFVILDPNRVRNALTGRQVRYGSNALLLTLAFLGILIVLNYLAFQNTPRWDLTQDQIHTLAPETKAMLDQLPEPVHVLAFYSQRMNRQNAQTLLESFKANSGGDFSYEFIDPEADPISSQTYNITRDGTIVFVMGQRSEQVTFPDEQEFTSVLIRLSSPEQRHVYFLTGHGEYDPTQTGQEGYGQVKSTLEKKNYLVSQLNLLSKPTIPEDALAIVVAGPQQPLSQAEVDLLSGYLANGGSVIYLSEPAVLMNNGTQSDPENLIDPMVEYLANTWGIQMENDLIVDPTINPPVITAVNQYGNHSITARMQSLAAVFPTARSLNAAGSPEGVNTVPLAMSSELAWGETDISSIEANQVKIDPGVDREGPLNLAIAADNPTTKSRVVVVGDADFASNTYYNNYGNGDFIINIVDWAAQQENLLSITPKEPTQRFMIPPNRIVLGLIFLSFVCLMPGLVVLFGIVTWIGRRKRG